MKRMQVSKTVPPILSAGGRPRFCFTKKEALSARAVASPYRKPPPAYAYLCVWSLKFVFNDFRRYPLVCFELACGVRLR